MVQRTILHKDLTREMAYGIEYIYRPAKNIGWNGAIGGLANNVVQETPIYIYHISNPTTTLYFKSIAEAELTLFGKRTGRFSTAKARGNNVYGKDGYAIDYGNTNRALTITVSESVSKALTGIKKTKPSHFKGATNRWSNEQKNAIGAFHKGKTISEKQRTIVSQKNRDNHPSCRPITLVHKDNPEKEYKFHSISEASRQLGLPLARLKSKVQRTLHRYGRDGWKITSYNQN